MTEAVIAAVAYLSEGEVILTAAEASLIASAVVVVGTAAYNASQQRAAKAAARDSYNANLTDHQVMIRSATAPRNAIYGRDKISGPIVFAQSTGDKGQYLHLVIALAGHECDAIETVYFNEVALPDLDANGFVTSGPYARANVVQLGEGSSTTTLTLSQQPSQVYSVTASGTFTDSNGQSSPAILTLQPGSGYTVSGGVHFTFIPPAGYVIDSYLVNYEWTNVQSLVRIRKHLGGAGQVADPDLVAECSPNWNGSSVGVGICYLYARLEYDTDVFGQIGIPNIAATVRGKKLFDSRTGTTAWSDNSALCTADYLRDTVLGLGSAAGEVPDAERNIAANIADEVVALDTHGNTQRRYTTNGTLSSADGRRANLETLLAPMAGSAVWVQGRWLMRAGAHRTSEFTLDESWIAQGTKQITPRARRSDLFNAVTGTFIDPTQGYAQVQIPPVLNATYEAEDGGKRVSTDVTMPFVNDSLRAQRLCKITLERARQAVTLKLTCNLRAYDTLPTQVGTVNLARYGFVGKLFEVRERTYDPVACTVDLTLVETASTVWDWNYGEATVVDPAPNTILPDPFAPPAQLTGLIVYTGTAQLLKMADGTIVTRGLVRWYQTNDVFVKEGGQIEVQWKLDDATTWQSAPSVPGDSVETLIAPLDDRRVTIVRVRPVNALGRVGTWAALAVVVVGKTQAPVDVSGFAYAVVRSGVTFKKNPNPEADRGGMELRLGTVWNTAVPLFHGDADTWTWNSPPVGTYTVLAKHYDTTGNFSLNAASVSVTVTPADAVQWTDIAGRPKLFRVVSQGGSDTASPTPFGFYNGETNVRMYDGGRSYMLAVLDRATGGVVFYRKYDVYGIGAVGGFTSATLAADLNGVTSAQIVVLWTFDEPRQHRLDGDLPAAMYRCGASRAIFGSPQWQERAAYLLVGIGGCGEGNGYECYSGSVYWDTNAWCDVSFQLQSGQLIVSGTNATPRTLADYSYTGSLDATTDVSLIARGAVLLNGNSATKVSGSLSWDEGDAYSRDSFTGGAFCSAVIAQTSGYLMFGLNSDPLTDTSYTSLDYAWHPRGDGLLDIYESGGAVAVAVGAYVAGDVLAVVYDGSRVIYSQNGTPRRTVAASGALKLFFDSAFRTVGATLKNIRFGPQTDISTAIAAASAAAEAAGAAQTSANNALGELANIESDGVLTPVEKPAVVRDYSVLTTEQAGIDSQATNYAVTTEKSAYDNAIAALTSYLGTLTTPTHWDDLSGNTTLVGSSLRSAFITAYTARQAVLDKVSANAKARLGTLATMNGVDTPQIAPNATTEVYVVTPSSAVTVTQQSFTPDGYSHNTLVASITFTPASSGQAQVFFDGVGHYTNSSSVLLGDATWSLQNSGAAYDAWRKVDVTIPKSSNANFSMHSTRSMAVVGGTAYTIGLYANKLSAGDTFTVDNMELRVEVVKR